MANTDTLTTAALSDRLLAFANLMAAGSLSATQAYINAGYSPKGAAVEASRALRKPHVQQAIAARKQEIASSQHQLQVTPALITSGLLREAQHADTASARVAAWRTLADIHGMMSGSQTQLPQALGAFLEGVRQAREAISPASTGKQPALLEGTPVNQEEDTHA